MSDTPEVSDLFNESIKGTFGKGTPIGTVVRGTVIDVAARQQIDLDTGKPAFWDDGGKKMQLVVTVQTDERLDGDDDGRRRLYAKKPSEMLRAIGKATGGKAPEVGATLVVKYTGDGEPPRGGLNPPKLYDAAYKAPEPAGVSDLLDDATPPAATSAAELL